MEQVRKTSRVAMSGPYPKDTDARTCTSRSGKCIDTVLNSGLLDKSKSVHGCTEKTDLSACNMAAREARKADRERVQVTATVRDRNLLTPQGTTQPKEIYDTAQQDSAGLHKTGVGPAYCPKGSVAAAYQYAETAGRWVKVSARFFKGIRSTASGVFFFCKKRTVLFAPPLQLFLCLLLGDHESVLVKFVD